jgi:predicted nucleic acid-binding protein
LPRYLVDTDVFVDHLRIGRRVPVAPSDSAYSALTRAELYAGRNADEDVIDTLLSPFEEVAVDRPIAEDAGRIRRAQGLALADAVIAATAKVTRRRLVTSNTRHFQRVPSLKIHAPRRPTR